MCLGLKTGFFLNSEKFGEKIVTTSVVLSCSLTLIKFNPILWMTISYTELKVFLDYFKGTMAMDAQLGCGRSSAVQI